MRFLWYVRASNYVVVASGLLALLITDDYGWIAAGIFTALLVIGWNVDAGRMRVPLSPWLWNLIIMAFLAYCVVNVIVFNRYVSVGLANMLAGLLATKLLRVKQHRDYVILSLLSFFLVLISSIMTFSYLFALACVLFVVAETWAFILLHLKREIETYVLAAPSLPASTESFDPAVFDFPAIHALVGARFFVGTCGVTLITLLLSVMVFILLPRAQEGVFFRYGIQRLGTSVSGFSEEVELDTFGNIRQDHTPVMRVELPQIAKRTALPGRLYWGGMSYNAYDGRRWKSTLGRMKSFGGTSGFQPRIWLSRPTEGTANLLEQRIDLASTEYKVLFGAHPLRGVEGRFLSLQYDQFTGNSRILMHPYSPRYTVFSSIERPSPERLRHDQRRSPANIRAHYLDVPDLPQRIISLAHELGQGRANPYDIAVAVQEYLSQNYAYSLHVNRSANMLPFLIRRFPGLSLRLPGFSVSLRTQQAHSRHVYLRMLHLLANQGIIKHNAVTPGEFAEYIKAQHPRYAEDVRAVTSLYYAIRYGQHRLLENERRMIEHCLSHIATITSTSA